MEVARNEPMSAESLRSGTKNEKSFPHLAPVKLEKLKPDMCWSLGNPTEFKFVDLEDRANLSWERMLTPRA